MVTHFPVIASKTCHNAFKGMITDQMTCFGNRDSCEIPHGAPVDCDGELQGIFSWVLCGDEGLGVFAKVCQFNNWMERTMASN